MAACAPSRMCSGQCGAVFDECDILDDHDVIHISFASSAHCGRYCTEVKRNVTVATAKGERGDLLLCDCPPCFGTTG